MVLRYVIVFSTKERMKQQKKFDNPKEAATWMVDQYKADPSFHVRSVQGHVERVRSKK